MNYIIDKVFVYDLKEIEKSKIWENFPEVRNKIIFVKPNLVTPPTQWDFQSITHPFILESVLRKLKKGKAKKIIVGDCGFKDQWQKTIINSGYKDICEKYEVELICVQEGENYHKYTLKRFKEKKDYLSLYGVKFSDYYLDSDICINIPKMKVHSMAGITGGIKNMMGVISPKGSMHPRGSSIILQKRLVDLYHLCQDKETWVLMDGIIGSEYSEQFGKPKKAGVLISGEDSFEIDSLAAQVMGFDMNKIRYLNLIQKRDNKNWPEILSKEYIIKFEIPLSRRREIK